MDATTLGNMTLPELQQECKRRGIKKGGAKVKLIQRIVEHVEKFGPDYVATPAPQKVKTPPAVVKEVHQIENSHPYMAEYEQQLIDSANAEAQMECNTTFNEDSTADVSQNENTGMNHSVNDAESQSDGDFHNHRSKIEDRKELIGNEKEDLPEVHQNDDEVDELFNYVAERDANEDTNLDDTSEPKNHDEDDKEQKNEECNADVQAEENAEKVEDENFEIVDKNFEVIDMEEEVEEEEKTTSLVEKETEEQEDVNIPEESSVENKVTENNKNLVDEDWGKMTDGNNERILEDWGTLKDSNEESVVEDWGSTVEEDNKENDISENKSEIEEMVDEDSTVDKVEVENNERDDSDKIEDGEITVLTDESQNDFADNAGDDHLDVMVNDKNIDDAENDDIVAKQKTPPKKTVVPVSLKKRVSLIASTESAEEKAVKRRRRWGATAAALQDSTVPISSESIKKLIPEMKIDAAALENVPELDYQEEDIVEVNEQTHVIDDVEMSESTVKVNKSGRTVKVDTGKKITLNKTPSQEVVTVESDSGEVTKPMPSPPVRTFTLDDEVEIQEQREKSPSPARNPISQYICIDNLVRPYTIIQLKSLIRRTGNICEKGFWINNIKSHCYVKLSSDEEASATREAIHGIRWPPGSPKFLIVDFAINDKMYKETGALLGQKAKIVIEIEDKENDAVIITNEFEPRKELPVERKSRNERRSRRISRDRDRMKGKEKRHEEREESPAKRLEDLFKKTKATPCIYWLPLTEEQILERARHAELDREAKDNSHERSHDTRDRTSYDHAYDRNTDRRSQQYRTNRSWR